jgi:hypothetical protein
MVAKLKLKGIAGSVWLDGLSRGVWLDGLNRGEGGVGVLFQGFCFDEVLLG